MAQEHCLTTNAMSFFIDNTHQVNVFYDPRLDIVIWEHKGPQSNINIYSDR